MNTKEILQKLRDVFTSPEIEAELSQDIELSEEVKEVEVVQEEVELAEEAPVEEAAAPMPEEKVEYATKVELQEFKQQFLDLLSAMQKSVETKAEVPQELSSDKKEEEVELSDDAEEISHSPEVEVDKNLQLKDNNKNLNSIQSRVFNTLFN